MDPPALKIIQPEFQAFFRFLKQHLFLMRNQPKIISGIDYQGTKDQVSAALKVLGQGVAMESALETCCLYIDFWTKM